MYFNQFTHNAVCNFKSKLINIINSQITFTKVNDVFKFCLKTRILIIKCLQLNKQKLLNLHQKAFL
jgi:hypothetical protein